MKRALIFANGEIQDGPMVRQAFASAPNPIVIAADGGARIALSFDFRIHTVIGDFDSLSPQEINALVAEGVAFQHHPPEKDFTDLELALYYASDIGVNWIRIVGGTGGRLDQTLANVYLLAMPILANRDVRMVAGKQEIRLLYPGEHKVTGVRGDTLSLIPLDQTVAGITTEDLLYPLMDEALIFGTSRGISNVLEGDAARITFQEGLLLLVHTIGRV